MTGPAGAVAILGGMTVVQVLPPVRESITVAAAPELAFRVFAEQFGVWWPKEYSISSTGMADFVVEPQPGGRWYEVGTDGAECATGSVTAYEPPLRLVLAWHLDGNWHYDPDPSHASEVEIRFVPGGPESTHVEIEHRHFERHGAGAHAVRDGVSSRGGWGHCLASYSAYLQA
jgi:uncharacterized protein YndB with AHSA1/START domain